MKDFLANKQALLIVVGLFVFSVFFSGNVLRQGQQIKQFYSHSVTEALRDNGFQIFKTYLPCTDIRNGSFPRPWAEEPPIYYLFGAVLEKAGLGPQWASLLVGLLLSFVFCLLLKRFYLEGSKQIPLLLLLILTAPVFMRHYTQHMPDTCAVLFSLLGVYFLLDGKEGRFIFFSILAVTTKAFAFFPIGLLVGWWYFIRPLLREKRVSVLRQTLLAGSLIALLILPFSLWVYLLKAKGLPSPYDFSSVMSNRHSGRWDVLLSPKYWDRYFTFIGTKGVGWVLFLGFLSGVPGFFKKMKQRDPLHEIMWVWAFGMVPFWIFVREASIIHDHYVLQYFLPIAFLGAERLLSLRNRKLRVGLMTVSVVMGLSNPVIWRFKAGADPSAPQFCWAEEHSLKKFPLLKESVKD